MSRLASADHGRFIHGAPCRRRYSIGRARRARHRARGRPARAVEQENVIIVGLRSTKVPTLPKGVPAPAAPLLAPSATGHGDSSPTSRRAHAQPRPAPEEGGCPGLHRCAPALAHLFAPLFRHVLSSGDPLRPQGAGGWRATAGVRYSCGDMVSVQRATTADIASRSNGLSSSASTGIRGRAAGGQADIRIRGMAAVARSARSRRLISAPSMPGMA
jgi:hypothetical protein